MPDSRPLSYAIVGATRFAGFCLDAYSPLEDLHPVAVWDRNPARAASLAEKYGLRVYEKLEELAAHPGLDIAHIASVPSAHAAQALTMLRAGIHVLGEKPLATSIVDAEAMLSAARDAGVRCGVNFMMRHSPLWPTVKTLVEELWLGAFLRGQVLNCAGDSGLPDGHWFWDPEVSGGIFVEHGVHFFDLLTSWIGQGGEVTSAGVLPRPGTTAIDQAFCEVRYGGRAGAGFYHGFHQPNALDRQEIRLVFEAGEVVVKGWVAGEMEVRALTGRVSRSRLENLLPGWIAGASSLELDHFQWQSPHGPTERYLTATRDLMSDFLRAVRDPAYIPRVTGEDGLAALRQADKARTLSHPPIP